MLSKKEPELGAVKKKKKSQPMHIAKVRKLVLKRTLSVFEQSFDKEIMSMAHEIISHLSRDQRYR